MLKKKLIEKIFKEYLDIIFKEANKNEDINIYFSRGTFKHDIRYFIKTDQGQSVIVNSNILRILFKQLVSDLCLEQIICLEHRKYVNNTLSKIIYIWEKKLAQYNKKINVIFGGVDYFEVCMFHSTASPSSNISYSAYFHENYTIEYVKSVSEKIYRSIKNPILFDHLFVYGPPAYDILKEFTPPPALPTPIVMPRLKNISNRFKQQLIKTTGKTKVLYLAFPGYDYLAPLTFSSILISLSAISYEYDITVKYKNLTVAKKYKKRMGELSKNLNFVDGDVVDYLVNNDIVVAFNSLSFYESLLSRSLIIIPIFSDTEHDNNILQESPFSIKEIFDFQSIKFAKSESEIINIIQKFNRDEYLAVYEKEKEMRVKLLSRKFYYDE
ncbi:hypothetical protein [Photorhabdus temperata]|uniref:Uncharacterized protein n=1 Tax=Photorhabdus temperata subsp. temperata Meg1 TaxID=1393735 RepID=A0A081RV23_PHOTE|nr:hypothetical protein [Photorhabdus temperata]KER02526.1 hypothetical protein MEG1DRAFT_02862 [Photorhabdus temperata subsp. temperata Meg1]